MVPGDRRSFFIETGREPVEESWPVHVVLDVFFAGPHELDGTIDVLGDLDRANDAIDLEPPSEAAAEQMVVHHDLVQRHAGGFRCCRLGSRQTWLPTQISQPSLCTCAVQFIGSMVACARNGTW